MEIKKCLPDGIRNILFDIGNVLVDLDVPATVRAFGRLNIGGLRPEDIHPNQTGLFLDYELGRLDDAGFIRAIRRTYDCRGVADEQIFAAWNALLLDPEPERFELIRQLKDNYRLFVLSNTNPQHVWRLRERFRTVTGGGEFEDHFERCYYSHDLRLRKPDPEIYRQVLARADILAGETLFIDDNLCNIPSARALHLQTHHLACGESLRDIFG